MAALAMPDGAGRLVQRAREHLCALAVVLQHVKSHALRRLDAHARQAPQRLDQGVQ
ncbi:hypothetical protein SDC9_150987 [bioreactor metagenome]|uniref:Uncharacterized protein n=1 Tax=bioreactor metagenome TaxID=1076179 RepID=A0A645ET99_9ZZZZ